ncbi:uncharacterized protein L969DRAFT_100774 [Mixia osmundae IAM 14324]|uniref:Uncharacterized protein n=1 Tax=Mixia osmundae (strain CBS 9802 / IAM 14324 / JCM 22182 / KY 12970) TaxID=764103 RepID=G7E0C0_MIXOS|nr:uncharacterized protein L969DRAFT_100774 [Mixia osmundae IAM 14324]KEI42272.1 hypothetical protein L969DRAFT_100774 [Mixia osmundae IAM 14324]GAA96280.1 hypothetical protein E5Q_02946 [Mixia osmundae IAM 14324]
MLARSVALACFCASAAAVEQIATQPLSGRDVLQTSDASPDIGGYINPFQGKGSFIAYFPDTKPLGEPINIIISSDSSPGILTNDGLERYFAKLNFSGECLGKHLGNDLIADLGDGRGPRSQDGILRYNFGDPAFGTCQETVNGGNHLRWWNQTQPDGKPGAIYIAASVEEDLAHEHTISPNGYNLGRDYIVGNATKLHEGRHKTTARSLEGLLPIGKKEINHDIAIDGKIALLTVHRISST